MRSKNELPKISMSPGICGCRDCGTEGCCCFPSSLMARVVWNEERLKWAKHQFHYHCIVCAVEQGLLKCGVSSDGDFMFQLTDYIDGWLDDSNFDYSVNAEHAYRAIGLMIKEWGNN